jgi:hypothetical protein
MGTARRKEVKYVAVGYAIYAVMYLVMGVLLISVGGWGGLQQLSADLEIIGRTLFLITSAFLMNVFLAVGSWRVLSLPAWNRRLLLSASIGLALVIVMNNIPGLWRWYQGILPADIGPPAVAGGVLVALGYVFLAYSLIRIVVTSNTSFNPDAQKRRAG